ncbi:MAG: alpha/beta fold hydrolase [Rhodobacter sp.]|nr:alpha/beta fold hydrolase [Rhodobacter sp.]
MEWPPPQDWPNRPASRRVYCPPHRWHVQEDGEGKTLLLLHGAGGATQTWRGLFPLLAKRYHVVAPDLPAQGFTQLGTRQRRGLDEMSEDLVQLCEQEQWRPYAIVGHSAGAAISLRLSELLTPKPRAIVGLNAALGEFDGVAGVLFPFLAKGFSAVPFAPDVLSRLIGTKRRVTQMLNATGSQIGANGLRSYMRLVRDPAHVKGTLLMMAQWRLKPLLSRLDHLDTPTLFLVGGNDQTVRPDISRNAAERMPNAVVKEFPGLGHLAHEEAPGDTADEIHRFVSA